VPNSCGLDVSYTYWIPPQFVSCAWIMCYQMFDARGAWVEQGQGPVIIDLEKARAVIFRGTVRYQHIEHEPEGDVLQYQIVVSSQQAPVGDYLVLYIPFEGAKENCDKRDESAIQETVCCTLGLLMAICGRCVAWKQLFEAVIDLRTGEMDTVGPTMEFPGWFAPADVGEGQIDLIRQADHAIHQKGDFERNRLQLSLRWFHAAVLAYGPDAIVKFWVALESLVGGSDVNKLKSLLGYAYRLPTGAVENCFVIGKMYGLRADIVHHGKWMPIDARLERYLSGLYVDILFEVLGLPPPRRAIALLQQGDFSVTEYLRKLVQKRHR